MIKYIFPLVLANKNINPNQTNRLKDNWGQTCDRQHTTDIHF
jgi:hypothetical protein